MKLFWKYIAPVLLVFAGVNIWNGDPTQPFSSLLPLTLGYYQKLVATVFILVGIFAGIAVFLTEQDRKRRK